MRARDLLKRANRCEKWVMLALGVESYCMMPFSVLRIWLGGLFSWLVLGLAVYCLWEAWRRMDQRPLRSDLQELAASAGEDQERLAREVAIAEHREPAARRRAAWPYLACGLG